MAKRNNVLWLAVCIAAFLVIGAIVVKPEPADYPPYLASSPDRDGVKALYTLMEENGVKVKPWRQAWRFLPEAGGQALVVIQPYEPGDQERERLLEWVAAGNDLILFHSRPADWGVLPVEETAAAEAGLTAITVEDDAESRATDYNGEVSSSYRLNEQQGWDILFRDVHGALAGRMSFGQGSVTLFVVPEWVMNQNILKHSHFELIWPHLNQSWSAVWFDEYYHGVQVKPGLLAVYPEWLLAIALQLILVAALWLLYKGVRFGPAYTPREWTVRSGDETLLAAAGWYEQRKLAREALRHQERYVRSLLRERWGVRADATDQQLLAAARGHWDKEKVSQLEELLRCWQHAEAAASYSAKQFVLDSRKADAIIRQLERE